MPKYRAFIEDYFLIDEPKQGKLVPFNFNKVQNKYYDELCRDYDIEKNGITIPVRELDLKARREGFSSLILALFAADDILTNEATETLVISYKDDATSVFRKRYRLFVLSYFARKQGFSFEQIARSPNMLDGMAKMAFSQEGNGEFEIAHNHAHFFCGTASARTGGRGGVVQKILFSEAAHYPDTDKMTAKEVVEGTARQVDIASGWVFVESTANGVGNHYHQMWDLATKGKSRYKPRFYGWREFYSEDEFKIIASEFATEAMLRQEYPETPDEAFAASGSCVFKSTSVDACVDPKLKLMDNYDARFKYKFGFDLAMLVDWTVGVGINKSRHTVEVFDRYNQIDYNLQKARIEATLRRFGDAEADMDRTGVGIPIVQDLQSRGLNIRGIVISEATKRDLIINLAIWIEQRKIRIPAECVDLIEELKIFRFEILPSGKIRYSAPEGKHDDCVIALALAVWELGSKLSVHAAEENQGAIRSRRGRSFA